jgi:hyperosmotically inducible periplasmic protein
MAWMAMAGMPRSARRCAWHGIRCALKRLWEDTMMQRLLCAFVTTLLTVATVAGPARAADRSIGEKMDDAKITTAVKTKLAADRVKNLVNVSVETNDGTVRLTGKVPTAEDKFQAERIARRTDGVRDVKNELRVESNASPSASPK